MWQYSAFLAALSVSFFLPQGLHASPLQKRHCKCTSDDFCWPNPHVWSKFNDTLNGGLISNIPLAMPCHDPHYDEGKCSQVKEKWDFPAIHAADPASVMIPIFQNGTCDPYHPVEKPCTLGNLVQYSVKATETGHVQAAVKFAAEHNVRLTVKNTGHDFLGRSTAEGALGLWTHNMDKIEVIQSYASSDYSGPVMKMGAGTQAAEAYEAAYEHGYRVMGGSCPTVGLAGGFTQGGGHGVLSSEHGLSADSVVEWEVVTAAGELVKASPSKNSDLFWALSGGGGGTFGVVVSMTAKLFPESKTTGGILAFDLTTSDDFWGAVTVLQSGTTPLVDSGTVLLVGITNSTASVTITAPSVDKQTLEAQLEYITSHLNESSIPYSLDIQTDASYFEHFKRYFGPFPNGIYPVSHLMGSRLLPRSLFESKDLTTDLMELGKSITANNEWAISAVTLNVNETVANITGSSNSVNPAWRDALVHYTVYSSWDWSSDAEMLARSDRLTNEISPSLEALTPGSGSYANEGNYRQKGWQEAFFGPNWKKLNDVKARWDKDGIFYAPLSVGADKWSENSKGKLCLVH